MKNLILIFTLFATSQLYGQVGIGTSTPLALFHVANGNVVFTAAPAADLPADPPMIGDAGEGNRLVWYASKGALIAGIPYGVTWDADNIGNHSLAIGEGPLASGTAAVALGEGTIASGTASTALNRSTIASGAWSVAMGDQTQAIGAGSFAMGDQTQAIGRNAAALGAFTTAPSYCEVAIGRNNTEYTPLGLNRSWNESDRLLVLGNGADTEKSDALTVLKNGNTGIGFSIGSADLTDNKLSVNGAAAKVGGGAWAGTSDRRAKKNIEDYHVGLKEVLAIRPVRFQYNHLSGYADTTKHYVGVIAQEIEKVLPSTVSTVTSDPLLENKKVYDSSELLYTLINAVKELNSQNQELRNKLVELEAWKLTVSSSQKGSNASEAVAVHH